MLSHAVIRRKRKKKRIGVACWPKKFVAIYIQPLIITGVFCQTDNGQMGRKLDAFSVQMSECTLS